MNPLPSTAILNFFEWLKNHSVTDDQKQHIDLFDLIDNEENYSILRWYAEEYVISLRKHPFSYLLSKFADSGELADYLRHCSDSHCHRMLYGIHRCIECQHIYEAFRKFLEERYYDGNELIFDENEFNPEELIRSARYYLIQSNNMLFKLNILAFLGISMSTVLNFLDWLLAKKNKYINLSKMPLSVFKDLVSEYCVESGNSSDEQELIKAFKKTDPNSLSRKVLTLLTRSKADKMKSLGYIFDRYSNDRIPYRCLFLPYYVESASFEAFINKYWMDLNYLSSDYLDIFYSEADFKKSGYQIKSEIRSFNNLFQTSLPCIVLWKQDMNDAKCIGTSGLSEEQLFELVKSLVGWIQESVEFPDIVERSNKLSAKMTKPVLPITQIFRFGKVKGPVIGVMDGGNIEI